MESEMTANEPSVAELVADARKYVHNVREGFDSITADELDDTLTRLERRCAEMEKAINGQGYRDLDQLIRVHQRNVAWLDRLSDYLSNHHGVDAEDFLPPERANEGTKP